MTTNRYEFIIDLNPNVLQNATKDILATLLHEGMHAFFRYENMLMGDSLFKETYGPDLDMVDGKLVPKSPSVITDHALFEDLIGAFQQALIGYSGFNSARALALAKGGIMTLTPAEKQINDQERASTAGHTGTSCKPIPN